jgi:hypothetical protein
MTTPEQFQTLLSSPEGARVEFKSATSGYDFDKLAKCCVALANEGGGEIVLGVTDKRPRQRRRWTRLMADLLRRVSPPGLRVGPRRHSIHKQSRAQEFGRGEPERVAWQWVARAFARDHDCV